MDNSVAGGNQSKSLPEIAQNADNDHVGCLDSEFGSFEFVKLSEIDAEKEAEENVVAGINDIAITENPVGNNLIGLQRTSRTFFRPPGLEDDDKMPDNVIECPRCGYMNLRDTHQCTMCEYRYTTEVRLKKHMQDSQTPPEDRVTERIDNLPPSAALSAAYLGQQKSSKGGDSSGEEQRQLSTASDLHIPKQKQLKCTHCEYSTEYKHHLAYHYRSHNGQEPFKCNTCAYTCVNKSLLNSHMRSHTPNYQFRCRDCTYQTKYCHSMKMHLKKYGHKRAPDTGGSESSDSHGEERPENGSSSSVQLKCESFEHLGHKNQGHSDAGTVGKSGPPPHSLLIAQHQQMVGAEMEMASHRSLLQQQIDNKLSLLEADNREMQARLETVEHKLKVAELEAKLTKQEMRDLIAEKVAEAVGQLREEKNIWTVTNGNDGWGQFSAANDETRKKEDGIKIMMNNSNQSTFVWRTNGWEISDDYQKVLHASEDGLVVTVDNNYSELTVRAKNPVSHATLGNDIVTEIVSSDSGQQPQLFYYEVIVRDSRDECFWLGWAGADFPLCHSPLWIGQHPGSYAINSYGDYWGSGHKIDWLGEEFHRGDVVGSGVLLTRDGRLKVFFTKNGEMNSETLPLDNIDDLMVLGLPKKTLNDIALYPAVSLRYKGTSVEANFGAEPAKKPFKFDIRAHEKELFN